MKILFTAGINAGTVITAWQNEKLIGLVEVLDDGEVNAYIHYLLVAPIYQNYLYLVVICERKETVSFYQKQKFTLAESAVPLQILTL